MLTPDRYARIRELFIEVCELDPLRRSAILDERCADDSELRGEVESLLAAERSDDDWSEAGGRALMAAGEADVGAPAMPDRIGKYRILRLIGEGGMGTVFEAEQDHPRRSVAIKIVRPGLVSESMRRRFTHEARVLGLLRHAGIAQIHDAGTNESASGGGAGVAGGQPYFVMELVHGPTLLKYAAERGLSARAKLGLMADIADAVHHAHTKGVVHRDLKPGNILVEEIGGKAQPKILDFGVARATDSDIRATTIEADAGRLIGTLAYMSPEQASGDTDQIDTRSDVYSLGVVLYELLAARLPYELDRKKVHEAARIIREDEPSRLSSIDRGFRGDVETIVAKATEKDKERRYQSAADFAADIRRYLSDEPIIARPASAMYQWRKFAKRNKALVAAASIAFAILLCGIVGTSWGIQVAMRQRRLAIDRLNDVMKAKDKAESEARKAEAVTTFFQAMIASAGPEVSHGRDLSVRVVLDKAAENTAKHPLADVDSQAAIEDAIGRTYRSLGEPNLAINHAIAACALRRGARGDRDPLTLASMGTMAGLLLDLGRLEEAESAYRDAYALASEAFGAADLRAISLQQGLAQSLKEQGRLDEAEATLNQAMEKQRQAGSIGDPSSLATLDALAAVKMRQGKASEAAEMYRRILDERIRLLGDADPETAGTMNDLALALKRNGKLSDAEAMYRRALDGTRAAFGPRHINTASCEANLVALLTILHRFDEAQSLCEEAVDIKKERLGENNPSTLISMNALANLALEKGDLDRAEDLHRVILQKRRECLGADHADTLASMHNLAQVLSDKKRYAEAVDLFQDVVQRRKSLLGPRHQETLISLNGLVQAMVGQRRMEEALPLINEGVEAAVGGLGSRHWITGVMQGERGDCLAMMRRFDEAEPSLLESRRILESALGERHDRTRSALRRLISLYKAWGKPDDQRMYEAKLEAIDGATPH